MCDVQYGCLSCPPADGNNGFINELTTDNGTSYPSTLMQCKGKILIENPNLFIEC